MKIISNYRYCILVIILLGCLLAIVCIVNADSKFKVQDYKGDGNISYLNSPGPLGTDGFKVVMPTFELSRHIEREYNLEGMPKGDDYFIYLVVDDSKFNKDILSGTFRVLIKSKGKIMSQEEGSLSSMIRGRWSNKNWFYFRELGFKLNPSLEKLSITASYSNDGLKIPISANIVIERGGFK